MGRPLRGLENLKGHDFYAYRRKESSADVKIKLLGLTHLQEGKSINEVASILKVFHNTVREWVHNFADKGLDGLRRQPGQGRRKRLDRKLFPQIKAGILALQKERAGGRCRGEDVQKYLSDEYGVDYKLTAIYDLLKELGIVWISARSKHPASNKEAQESFKKTLLIMLKPACHQKQI